ncbi:MAG TPA: hypothetical protein ENI81_02180, partial [Phycisphaerales bacterium]|nr:hypothetical protein [Phycisphaerales bacterium]
MSCLVTTAKAAIERLNLGAILAVFVLLSTPAFGAAWEMRVTGDGAMEISCSQVPVVQAGYRFWGQNWK